MNVRPEKIDDVDQGSGGSDLPIDGLTPEEQAQIDAMNGGKAGGDADNVDPAGDAEARAPGDDDGDDELEPGADGAGDREAAGAGDKDPAAADGADKRPAPKTVSYGKYQRELAKIQQARDDLQAQLDGARNETKAERDARLRLDERTKLLLEAIQSGGKKEAPPAEKPPEDPEPDGEEDPIAHAAWTSRELKRTQAMIRDMSNGVAQDRNQRQTMDAEEQVLAASTAELTAAAAEKPEVAEAFVHYRESRYSELGYAFAGIDINDPAQCAQLSPQDRTELSNRIQQTFRSDCLYIAREAQKRGRPIVGEVMSYARARGYRPGAAAPAAPAEGDAAPAPAPAAKRNGNGAAPAAPRAPAPTVGDQLQQIRENAAASKSLSDAGGAPGGEMSLERLADMPQEDFEQYYEALKSTGRLDKMMGKVPI